jgi:uncharacterized membrane protein
MVIAFMPFTTAFFSEYPTELMPMALYGLTFAMAGILEILLWRYAIKSGLIDPHSDPDELSHLTWRMSILPAAGFAAILIAVLAKPVFAGFAFMLIPIAHRLIHARFKKRSITNTSELTEQN